MYTFKSTIYTKKLSFEFLQQNKINSTIFSKIFPELFEKKHIAQRAGLHYNYIIVKITIKRGRLT